MIELLNFVTFPVFLCDSNISQTFYEVYIYLPLVILLQNPRPKPLFSISKMPMLSLNPNFRGLFSKRCSLTVIHNWQYGSTLWPGSTMLILLKKA